MQASPTCLIRLLVLTAVFFGIVNGFAEPASDDVSAASRVTVRGNEVREFDWAKLQAQARIAYVSSGPRALRSRMIDNDLQTSFGFSESDKSPTVIVELSQSAQIHRISTVFKAEDAQVDVFLLNQMPKDMADLQFAKPVATVVSLPDERGLVTVNFGVSSARYIALRWKRKRWDEPFSVAEISAFSNDPVDWTDDNARLASNSASNFNSEPPPIPVVPPVPVVSP